LKNKEIKRRHVKHKTDASLGRRSPQKASRAFFASTKAWPTQIVNTKTACVESANGIHQKKKEKKKKEKKRKLASPKTWFVSRADTPPPGTRACK
jgi:hypothetical protein